jgi:uncharacterized protein
MSGSGDPRNNSGFATRFTFVGLLRWLRLCATGKQVIIEGHCIQCGVCCRELNLSRKSHWIRSKAEFARLAADLPEYKRFRHIGYSLTGLMKFDCECLSKEGYCSDYENRPDFCASYPEPDLYFMGGEIPPLCGFRFSIVPSFGRILSREIKRPSEQPDEQLNPPKDEQNNII